MTSGSSSVSQRAALQQGDLLNRPTCVDRRVRLCWQTPSTIALAGFPNTEWQQLRLLKWFCHAQRLCSGARYPVASALTIVGCKPCISLILQTLQHVATEHERLWLAGAEIDVYSGAGDIAAQNPMHSASIATAPSHQVSFQSAWTAGRLFLPAAHAQAVCCCYLLCKGRCVAAGWQPGRFDHPAGSFGVKRPRGRCWAAAADTSRVKRRLLPSGILSARFEGTASNLDRRHPQPPSPAQPCAGLRLARRSHRDVRVHFRASAYPLSQRACGGALVWPRSTRRRCGAAVRPSRPRVVQPVHAGTQRLRKTSLSSQTFAGQSSLTSLRVVGSAGRAGSRQPHAHLIMLPGTLVWFSTLRSVAIEKAGLFTVPTALDSLRDCLEVR